MNQAKLTCQKCGAPLAADARFCEECGTPVATSASGGSPPAKAHPSKRTQPAAKISSQPVWLAAGLIAIVIVGAMIALAVRQAQKPDVNPTQAALLPAETQVETGVDSPTASLPEVIIATEASEPAEQISPATAEPTLPPAVDTPLPAAQDPQVGLYDFEGVNFSYDPALAAFIETETVSAQTGNDLPPWELYPQHRVLSLRGYPLSGTFHEPKIIIYPTQEYLDTNPAIGDQVANLQQMLIGRRTDFLPDSLPFFTLWNAGQVIFSQIKFLDFKNGSGVRYITQYGQGVYPIDNQLLFYTFQGITSDKNWLISAILPVNNAVLPDPNTLLADPDFFDNYAAYLESTKILLDDLPDSSYLPGLALLDALFQSLEIQ